jgi:hypothetical protein
VVNAIALACVNDAGKLHIFREKEVVNTVLTKVEIVTFKKRIVLPESGKKDALKVCVLVAKLQFKITGIIAKNAIRVEAKRPLHAATAEML